MATGQQGGTSLELTFRVVAQQWRAPDKVRAGGSPRPLQVTPVLCGRNCGLPGRRDARGSDTTSVAPRRR